MPSFKKRLNTPLRLKVNQTVERNDGPDPLRGMIVKTKRCNGYGSVLAKPYLVLWLNGQTGWYAESDLKEV